MNELKKPKISEMCPLGYHIVHGHERACHSGTRTWVDTHLRKNRGRVQIFRKENILHLYWNSKKEYPKLKSIKGYKDNGELDPVIQFWLDYWKQQGLEISDFDPVLVKTMIAIESSFNPRATSKVKGSTAYGLMQITNQTRRILSGRPDKKGYRELQSEYLFVLRNDLTDPVVSIAAGTRWLFYKFSRIPKGETKNTHNTIKNYHSWNKDGEEYARRVLELFNTSK